MIHGSLKQHDVKTERVLNGNTFYVRPFGAFKAANMSGDIFSLLAPILAGFAPLIAGAQTDDGDAGFLDMEAEKAAPLLADALSGVSGDRIEQLMIKLLLQHKNISVELEGENEARILTKDIADDVFCGDVQDMFILAFEVIKANYSSFFKKVGGRFGGLIGTVLGKTGSPSSKNTGN